jgi:hypothetical protein
VPAATGPGASALTTSKRRPSNRLALSSRWSQINKRAPLVLITGEPKAGFCSPLWNFPSPRTRSLKPQPTIPVRLTWPLYSTAPKQTVIRKVSKPPVPACFFVHPTVQDGHKKETTAFICRLPTKATIVAGAAPSHTTPNFIPVAYISWKILADQNGSYAMVSDVR